ncbi:MAG: hypothetical protein F6K31_35645 [Symploca sp. SIO2G7]|nr:hypothetical protein [Symploca sp. SIO2G7]
MFSSLLFPIAEAIAKLVALGLALYLLYLCLIYFWSSKRIAIKLLAALTAAVIIFLSLLWLSYQLFFLPIKFPLGFCKGAVDRTIDFPDYHKKIYIIDYGCMLTSYDTIYIKEGWLLPKFQKIGSTPSWVKEDSTFRESDLTQKGAILEFAGLQVQGNFVKVIYNLETGETTIQEIEVE